MTVKLANGTILEPILVTGEGRYVQGFNRDVLTFVFPATESMDALDAAFTAEACETIIIDETNIHSAYTVRVEIKKDSVVVAEATANTKEVREDRIFVSMGQRTYLESQLQRMNEALNAVGVESI